MTRARVLLVEPDARLGRLTQRYLANHDLDATVLTDRSSLASELRLRRYACVVLDATAAELHDIDGTSAIVIAGRGGDGDTRLSPREIVASIEARLAGPSPSGAR